MSAGRPKGFDEATALRSAMDLFWRSGYKGTSLSELLHVMGISRQSLYDTFGNKRDLFIRVLEHYQNTELSQALAMLDREGSPVDNVESVVRFFEALGRDPACRGCLVANSIVEFGPGEDEEIASLLHGTLNALQGALQRTLEQAQQQGELPQTKSPDQISRALTNAIIGMAVTGRLRMDQDALGDVYAGTLSMLD